MVFFLDAALKSHEIHLVLCVCISVDCKFLWNVDSCYAFCPYTHIHAAKYTIPNSKRKNNKKKKHLKKKHTNFYTGELMSGIQYSQSFESIINNKI